LIGSNVELIRVKDGATLAPPEACLTPTSDPSIGSAWSSLFLGNFYKTFRPAIDADRVLIDMEAGQVLRESRLAAHPVYGLLGVLLRLVNPNKFVVLGTVRLEMGVPEKKNAIHVWVSGTLN
jgi:hypothetical protein